MMPTCPSQWKPPRACPFPSQCQTESCTSRLFTHQTTGSLLLGQDLRLTKYIISCLSSLLFSRELRMEWRNRAVRVTNVSNRVRWILCSLGLARKLALPLPVANTEKTVFASCFPVDGIFHAAGIRRRVSRMPIMVQK
jgi:hypothetical protein